MDNMELRYTDTFMQNENIKRSLFQNKNLEVLLNFGSFVFLISIVLEVSTFEF